MDSTVKKKRRRRASKISIRFYRRFSVIVLAAAIVCCGSLTYLWHWLKRYEEQSVNGAMTRYMEMVGAHKWHEIYEENVNNFFELNEEAPYTTYLVWLYEGKNVGGMTFAYSGQDDHSSYYDVYYQQEKICALEVTKPEGSTTWKVRTVTSIHNYSFDTFDGATFRINNHFFDEDFIDERNTVATCFKNSEPEEIVSLIPQVTRYSSGGFIAEPNAVPERNNDIVVRDSNTTHYYIGPRASKEQESEFTEAIKETTIAYCQYITQDGTFYELLQHLYPNTEFYNAISGFDSQWFSEHDSIEFRNMKVYDLMPMGDNAFIGSIAFDYIVTAGDIEKTYSSSYQLIFVKDDYDGWLLYKLSILSDSAQNE